MSGAHMMLLGDGGAGAAVTGAYTGGTVTFNSDGTCTGGVYSGPASWTSQYPSTGIGARHWARVTSTGGTGGVFFPAAGTWWSLSAGQTFSNSAPPGSRTGTIDFATDSAGSNIVASGTISVNNTF